LASLENLYLKYRDRGLVVLGFPTVDFSFFGKPLDANSVYERVANMNLAFPVFGPIAVNGRNAHPLFVFLKAKLPGWLGTKIQYHWTKFLVDRNGCPRQRVAPYGAVSDADVQNILET